MDIKNTVPVHVHPAEAIMELAGIILSSTSMEAVLRRATDVAKRTIAGAEDVSVTVEDGNPYTVAASGDFAVAVDETQYAAGAGPCLEALHTGRVVLVEDLTVDGRWPEYARHALEKGVRSSLSVPLRAGEATVGAFNSYSRTAGTFDVEARAAAESLAAYAGVVLNNAVLYFDAASRAEQLAEAMRSRAVIEQAKGILMGSRHCDADEAFRILVGLSQHSHRKLRDVAQAIVNEAVHQK